MRNWLSTHWRRQNGLLDRLLILWNPFWKDPKSISNSSIFLTHPRVELVLIDWTEAVCAQRSLLRQEKSERQESTYSEKTGFSYSQASWKINKVFWFLGWRTEKQTTRYFLKFMYSMSLAWDGWKDLLSNGAWLCRSKLLRARGEEMGVVRVLIYFPAIHKDLKV